MPIETLEQELKNPRLQAALASAWWSEEEAELILSALERSGLTVREFATAGILYGTVARSVSGSIAHQIVADQGDTPSAAPERVRSAAACGFSGSCVG